MDPEESFNDFKIAKQFKSHSKNATQKTKKQKKIKDFSSSQPRSNVVIRKGEPSLKKFLYNAPDVKYKIQQNEKEPLIGSNHIELYTDNFPSLNKEILNSEEIKQATHSDGINKSSLKETPQLHLNIKEDNMNLLCKVTESHGSECSDEMLWTCPLCSNAFPNNQQDSHFVKCVEIFQSKGDLEEESTDPKSFICVICKEDISFLNIEERSIHMNKCIDKQTSTEVNHSQSGPAVQTTRLSVFECPLCFKNFATAELRSSHVKKCSKLLGISIEDTILALQLQERHNVERMSLGLPLPVAKSSRLKSTDTPQRKQIVQPKSKLASDVQLAKALSLSLKEEEEAKQQELLSSFENVPNLSPSASFIASLKPPKAAQVPGKKVPKRKKNMNKPIPLLLLRSEEEREELLQKKVSCVIGLPTATCDKLDDIPEQTSVASDLNTLLHEDHTLWNLASKANEKKFYYIENLLEWVIPSEIKAGSKLLNLSQLPGHHIYTQNSCDYTFSSPKVPEQSSIAIPSTQEMLDIMMTDSSQNLTEITAVVPNSLNAENIPEDDPLNYTNTQAGYFFEEHNISPKCSSVHIPPTDKILDITMADSSKRLTQNRTVISAEAYKQQISVNNSPSYSNMKDDYVLEKQNLTLKNSSIIIPTPQEIVDITMTGCSKNLTFNNIVLSPEEHGEKISLNNSTHFSNTRDNYFSEDKKHESTAGSDAVIQSLQTLVGNSWMSDIDIFVADEKIIPAHKLLLMLRCPALKEILDLPCGEKKSCLNWRDISFEAALKFLSYLYTGADCWKEAEMDIYRLSIRYDLFDLQVNFKNNKQKCNDENFNSGDIENLGKGMYLTDHEDNRNSFKRTSPIYDNIEDNLNKMEYESLTLTKERKEVLQSFNVSTKDSCQDEINISYTSSENEICHKSDSNTKLVHGRRINDGVYCTNQLAKSPIAIASKYASPKKHNESTNSSQFEHNNSELFMQETFITPKKYTFDAENREEYSPEIFELDSDDEPISESIYNNTTLPVASSDNQNYKTINETLNSKYQSAFEPCFNDSNEVTILHESPSIRSSKANKEYSPVNDKYCNITSPVLKTKLCLDDQIEVDKPESDILIMRDDSLNSSKIIESINNNNSIHKISEVQEILVLEDKTAPSISPNINKEYKYKQSIEPKLNCSPRIDVLDEKDEIYISSTSFTSSQNFESHNKNHSPFKSVTLKSPETDKSIDKNCSISNYSPFRSPTAKLNNNFATSPTSIKCALAAERRRCLSTCLDQSPNLLNMSYQKLEDTEMSSNVEQNLPEIEEIYEDTDYKTADVTNKYSSQSGASEVYYPVILTSDDGDSSENENLPVFEDFGKSTRKTVKKEDLTPEKLPRFPSLVSSPKYLKMSPSNSKSKGQKKLGKESNCRSSNTATMVCIDSDENSCDSVKHISNVEIVEKNIKLSSEIQKRSINICSKNVSTPTLKKTNVCPVYKLSDSPLTPLPDYGKMETPEIKVALKKYGIRALPRKKAVTLLSHIYDETHPWVENGTEICTSQVQPSSSAAATLQKETKRKRKPIAKSPNKNIVKTKKSKKEVSQNKESQSTGIISLDNDREQIGGDQESTDEGGGSQSPNSSKSDENDFPEESILHLPDICEEEEMGNDDNVGSRIHQYILSNMPLYTRILMYEPLNLGELHDELKENHIKVALTKLMNFLDEQCITFTFPRKEEYRKKQQSRQQKFRKKMIAKLSQPSSEN